jgi:hypothetical protein
VSAHAAICFGFGVAFAALASAPAASASGQQQQPSAAAAISPASSPATSSAAAAAPAASGASPAAADGAIKPQPQFVDPRVELHELIDLMAYYSNCYDASARAARYSKEVSSLCCVLCSFAARERGSMCLLLCAPLLCDG